MSCGKTFGKILKVVKKKYPTLSRSKQCQMAWRILKSREHKRK